RSPSPGLHVRRRRHSALSRIRTDAGIVPAFRSLSLVNSLWYRASFKLDYWWGEGMPHWLSFLEAKGLRLWSPGLHKYLHYGSWFRTKLNRYLYERLTDQTTVSSHLWNRAFLDRL